MVDQLLTTRDVATWLRMSPSGVRRLARRGVLHSIRLRGTEGERRPHYRFTRDAVCEYLRRCGLRVPPLPADQDVATEAQAARARLRQRRRESASSTAPE